MTTYIWIKLYIEILDDPKIGLMPDWLKWRMIQLFLVAREINRDGLLGPVPQLAWRLRIQEEDLVGSLRTMSEIGIVAETPDGWLVVNFSKRQEAISSTERSKQYRKRERNEDETKRFNSGNEVGTVPSTSSSESGSVSGSEEEGVQGGKPIPTSPLEAEEHPDLQMFQEACGRLPGISQYATVIDTVQLLRTRKGNDLVAFLKPYWLAWSGRKRTSDGRPYDPASLTWLTEWAVNESVPTAAGDGGKGRAERNAEVIRKVAKNADR